jgi:serine/threonine-protein kinase OSR1/STK39
MPFFKGAKRKSYLVGAILRMSSYSCMFFCWPLLRSSDDLPPLTSRQERRRTSSHRGIDNTVESWDFSLSPTSSMTRHSRQASLGSAGLGVASPTTSIFRECDELEIAEEVAAVGDNDEEVSGGALDQVEEIQAEADTSEDPGPSSSQLEVASTPATSACDTDDPIAVAPSAPIPVPVPARPDSRTLTRSTTRISAITSSSPVSESRPLSLSASTTSTPTISLWRKLKRVTSAGNMKGRTEQQEDSSGKGRKRKSVMGNFLARGAGE